MPTSLSCISSVDQRRLAEETGCGDSVRQHSIETEASAGRSMEPVSTTADTRYCTECNWVSLLLHRPSLRVVNRSSYTPPVPMGHCLAERRTVSPSSMPIDSPHALASEGKDNSSGGSLRLALHCTQEGRCHHQCNLDSVRRNVGYVCLFANPTVGWVMIQ